MFVFPAFNKNYKDRKRTYKCCRKCRSKRIKCIIQSGDYETEGCENCRQGGVVCDLIKHGVSDNNEDSTSSKTLGSRNGGKTPVLAAAHLSPQSTNGFASSPHIKQELPNLGQSSPHSLSSQNSSKNHGKQAEMHTPGLPPPSTFPMNHIPQGPIQPVPLPHGMLPHQLQNPQLQGQMQPQLPTQMPTQIPPQIHSPMGIPNMGNYHPGVYQYPYNYVVYDNIPQPLMMPPHPHNQTRNLPATSPNYSSPFPENQMKRKDLGMNNHEKDSNHKKNISYNKAGTSKKRKTTKINAKYLKDNYNFNITTSNSKFYLQDIPSNKEKPVLIPSKHSPKQFHLRSTHVFEFLEAINAFRISGSGISISKQDEIKLLKIFFFKINSIFPIFDETEFWKKYNEDSVGSIVIYAMVLVILKDKLSEEVLVPLVEGDYLELLFEFAYELETKIRQLLLVLPELGDSDKLAKVQVYILLCLNFGCNKDSNEQSSQDLLSAISISFALLIHWKFTHDQLIEQGHSKMSMYYKKLWWVLFVLDRCNGVINSKAFFIKREDFDIDDNVDDEQLKDLIGRLVKLDNLVLTIYQPTLNKREQIMGYKLEAEKDLLTSKTPELVTIHSMDLQELGKYKTLASYLLKKMVSYLMLLIVNAAKIKSEKKEHEVNQISLMLCDGMLKLFKEVSEYHENPDKTFHINDSIVMQIPMVTTIFSLFMSVSFKYKVKLAYLAKLNQLDQREDLTEEGIKRILLTFENFRRISTIFKKWWFMKEIDDNFTLFLKKIETPNNHKAAKKAVQNAPETEGSIVPTISISSPSYYSIERFEKSMEEGVTKPKSLEHKLDYDQESIETDKFATSNGFETYDHVKDEKSSSDVPTIVSSVEEGSTDLAYENMQLLELINDDFMYDNLTDFVAQDPNLKDFFINI